MSKPLHYVSMPGVVERRIHVDDQNPYRYIQETLQSFDDDLAAQNRALGEAQKPGYAGYRLIARGVPVAVYEQSVREEWDEARWNRWLEDPDNRAFRVSTEKL
jgi:hypothetical protein